MTRASGRAAKVRIRLRPQRPQDFERLWEIDQACYEPRVAYSRRTLGAFLSMQGADCVVAEVGGKTAGFCITARRDAEAYIVTIDVLTEFRRRGVGSALLGRAETLLYSHSIQTIRLDTSVENISAISFWEKHGYRKIGVRKQYYPGGIDAFAMVKTFARKWRPEEV